MKLARKLFVLMTLAATLLVWGCQRDEAVTRDEPQQQQQERTPQQQEPGQTQGGQPQQQPGQQ